MTSGNRAAGRAIIIPMLGATTAVLAVLASTAVVRQDAAAIRHPLQLLAPSACATPATTLLASWRARLDDAVAEPPGRGGDRSVRMPTAELGAWARLRVGQAGEVTVERITAARIEAHAFGDDCAASVDVHEGAPAPDGAFSDAVLARLLARGQAGVILVWSPHMPLSVDQHAELQDAAAALGLRLVAVLDPLADEAFARRIARERHFGDDVLARLASVELAMRGMTTHAPSVQVFADGELKGPVLFGYRDRTTARLALAGVLAGR